MQQETAGLPSNALFHLATRQAQQRMIQRVRRSNSMANSTPAPQTLANISIPRDLEVINDQPFVLHDSGRNDSERFFIFGTARSLSWLFTHRNLAADGTFKVVPRIYYQLFTVHVMLTMGLVIPSIFALLPNKTLNTYRRFWESVRNLLQANHGELDGQGFNIIMDFEKGSRQTFSQVMNGVVNGCFFHFRQCLIKKVMFSIK